MTGLLAPFVLEQLLAEVRAVRARQDDERGVPDWENGTGPATMPLIMSDPLHSAATIADRAREWVEVIVQVEEGTPTWRDVMFAEISAALAADDPAVLRRALIQLIGTTLSWIETIDRRTRQATSRTTAEGQGVSSG